MKLAATEMPPEMAAHAVLDRLQGVRKVGPGRWIARSPVREDKRPSLSIRELPDGRVLLHDFGGGDVEDVLAAVGLRMTDLFPAPLPGHHYRPTKSRIPTFDMILMLDEEIMVASIITADFLEKRDISEDDWQRLAVCSQRLGRAVAELRR